MKYAQTLGKKKGRPLVNYKIRSIKGYTPKGFSLIHVDRKKEKLIFKKKGFTPK